MSAPAIRPAGPEFADAIAALQAACFDEVWGAAAVYSVLATPGGDAVLAVQDDAAGPAPVGFALFRTVLDEAELLAIGVLPPARNSGIGRALLNAVMARAAAAGAKALFLEVAADNHAAAALYRAAGFAEVGLRAGYYRRPGAAPADARVLCRTLEAPAPVPARMA